MFSVLRKAASRSLSRRTNLTAHFLDAPVAGDRVDCPELKVAGWLVFDKVPDGIEVTLYTGEYSLPLPLNSRPDVEVAHPGSHCFGFSRIFDLRSDLQNSLDIVDKQFRIRVQWSDGQFDIPLQLQVQDGYQHANSYFRSDIEYVATDAVSQAKIDHWRDRGYLLLPGFLSTDDVDEINADIDRAWRDQADYPPTITVDQQIGTVNEQRVALKDADPSLRQSPYKLNDLYQESPAIRDAVLSERLMAVLRPLIGGTPMICNSLSFEYGSQQKHHFDTFYMPPTVRNHMLATWIALEDVHPDAGPLEYFPGSHHIEPYRFRDGSYNLTRDQRPEFDTYIEAEIEREGLKQETFCARKGDVFIWHAHLFHGGSPIIDQARTRKSLVTHYFCREDWSQDHCEEFAPGRFYVKRF